MRFYKDVTPTKMSPLRGFEPPDFCKDVVPTKMSSLLGLY
jgi:hypothetical protein